MKLKFFIITIVIISVSIITVSAIVSADKVNTYKSIIEESKNTVYSADPDGKVPKNAEKMYKANKSINISKLKKVESIPEYSDAETIIKDSGHYVYKDTATYEEVINKLDELGFHLGVSEFIEGDRLINTIIVKCDNTYKNKDGKKIRNAYICWMYDAETGDFLGELAHRIK